MDGWRWVGEQACVFLASEFILWTLTFTLVEPARSSLCRVWVGVLFKHCAISNTIPAFKIFKQNSFAIVCNSSDSSAPDCVFIQLNKIIIYFLSYLFQQQTYSGRRCFNYMLCVCVCVCVFGIRYSWHMDILETLWWGCVWLILLYHIRRLFRSLFFASSLIIKVGILASAVPPQF